jgi:hypothetical protein
MGSTKMDVTFSKLMSLIGIVVFVGIYFMLSNNRGAIQRRVVGWGLGRYRQVDGRLSYSYETA